MLAPTTFDANNKLLALTFRKKYTIERWVAPAVSESASESSKAKCRSEPELCFVLLIHKTSAHRLPNPNIKMNFQEMLRSELQQPHQRQPPKHAALKVGSQGETGGTTDLNFKRNVRVNQLRGVNLKGPAIVKDTRLTKATGAFTASRSKPRLSSASASTASDSAANLHHSAKREAVDLSARNK